MDCIKVRGLSAETRVGASEEERAVPQPVIVDIDIGADLSKPGVSDDLDDTIDYAEVTSLVASLLSSMNAKLLEHLAEEVAGALLALEGVHTVSVQIAKETPPVVENVRNIAVWIERSRS